MATLAIKGHATRGKEVIGILEMIGGKNKHHYYGDLDNIVYYKDCTGYIEKTDTLCLRDYKLLTLEEFLEKFPYRIGDKVKYKDGKFLCIYIVKDLEWRNGEIFYAISPIDDFKYTISNIMVDGLCPFGEETLSAQNELRPEIDFLESNKDMYWIRLDNYEIVTYLDKTYAVKKSVNKKEIF